MEFYSLSRVPKTGDDIVQYPFVNLVWNTIPRGMLSLSMTGNPRIVIMASIFVSRGSG